jgi:hypothetical protein
MKGDKGKGKAEEIIEQKNFIIVALLVIAFIFIFAYFISSSETFKKSEIKLSQNSEYEEFKKVLLASDSLTIIENLTDVPESRRYLVINCGTGLARSWGSIGKNISKLSIYVINGNECYYSYPTMINVTGKLYELRNLSECRYSSPYFYISYGQPSSVFTNDSATIYVDESYGGECFFALANESTEEKMNES